MSSYRTEPCNWPAAFCGEPSTGEAVCSSLGALDPDMATLVQNMATAYLWNITGRQFGTCPVTIRPCKEECASQFSTFRGYAGTNTNLPYFAGDSTGFGGVVNPALIGGQWYNLPCGGCQNDVCSCTFVPTIDLLGPVASIDSIYQDGVLLADDAYRVDNFRYLVRTDGADWPVCQDMVAPTSATNTLEVTYQIGVPVPSGGQIAAGILACEFAKAACGNTSCKLPQRIQSVTRQQVSMTVLDSYGSLYDFGTTGLFLVDSWVASILHSSRRAGTRITSPDRYERRRTSWSAP